MPKADCRERSETNEDGGYQKSAGKKMRSLAGEISRQIPERTSSDRVPDDEAED